MRQELVSHVDASIELAYQYITDWNSVDFGELEKCFRQFAELLIDNGRYLRAEKVCTELLSRQKVKHGILGEHALQTEVQLSRIHFQLGQYERVAADMRSFASTTTGLDPKTFEIPAKRLLAVSLFKLDRYHEAEDCFKEVIAQLLKLQDNMADDPDLLDTKDALAQLYRNTGRHKDAKQLYYVILHACQSTSHSVSIRRWECMVRLANLYRAQGVNEKAVNLYSEALEGFMNTLGPDHPKTLSTKLFSSIIDSSLGRFEAACTAMRDVVERSAKVLGPNHPDTVKGIVNLAITLGRCEELIETEGLLREVLVIRQRQLGRSKPYTVRILERLVGLLWVQDRFDKAESTALEGLRPAISIGSARGTNAPQNSDERVVQWSGKFHGASEYLF